MKDFAIETGEFDRKEGYDPKDNVFRMSEDPDRRKLQEEALRRMKEARPNDIHFSELEFNKYYWEVTYEEIMRRMNEHANQMWKEEQKAGNDNVNHPSHYTSHPSGVECITITRHYCFAIGNAIKYLWRAGLKQDGNLTDKQKEIEDLQKAVWYINDRISQLQNEQ